MYGMNVDANPHTVKNPPANQASKFGHGMEFNNPTEGHSTMAVTKAWVKS